MTTSRKLSPRGLKPSEKEVDFLSLMEDFDLGPLFSTSSDLREAASGLAGRLQALLCVDSLSLYLASESSEGFELLVSLGRGFSSDREISEGTFSQMQKELEPLLDSQMIFKSSTTKPNDQDERERSLPAIFIPLRSEGRNQGLVVASAPQRELNQKTCKLAEWLCQTLTAALVLKDSQRETSSLKENYRRLEIQKGELTYRLQQKIFDLNSLFKTSNRLFAIHDERELAESLLEMVRELLRMRYIAFCGLSSKKPDDISILCSRGYDFSFSELPCLSRESSLYNYLQGHREPISLPDLASIKPREGFLLKLLELDFKATCGVYVGSQLHGLVLCGPRLDGKDYHHGDLEVLSILSNMASVALQSLRQFQLIEELSYTDSMTGLYNYRFFYKRLTEELTRAKRHDRKLSLVIFDLDEFKSYNDRFGHQTGDEILRQLSGYTKGIVRSIDVVCRYGGEEFCVIMPDTDREEAEMFVDRLREEIADYIFKIDNLSHSPKITASIGAAVFPEDADTVDRLIYCADMALLEAKKRGRNLAYLFSPQMVATG